MKAENIRLVLGTVRDTKSVEIVSQASTVLLGLPKKMIVWLVMWEDSQIAVVLASVNFVALENLPR